MKILVVEDDAVTNLMLNKYLAELDFEVVTASDGLQGWDFFCQEDIHFVITDWMMPGMDGLELIKKIRDRNEKTYCYIILLTAKNDQEEIVEGISGGADDYIVKPFHKEELAVRVRSGQRVTKLQEELFETNKEQKKLIIELKEDREVRTHSVGEGYYRKLKIYPKRKRRKRKTRKRRKR